MNFIFDSILLASLLFIAILVCVEIGYRMGNRSHRSGDPKAIGGGVIDGAIFALLGLLVAFTFSGAAERFDKRRGLIVAEANAIGTAYMRLSLLPAPARDELKEQFRNYVDTRLDVYRVLPDIAASKADLAKADRIEQQIWEKAVAASDGSQSTRILLLPAINEMNDIATSRTMAAITHPPLVIFGLLFGLSLITALLAGRAMASNVGRPWMHAILYALAMAGAVFVIVDMEYPRLGFIRLDSFDSVLADLRQSMN
ncbi:MAG: DUF4239 domain-containing protein [Betaproteobacteria bacterium]